MRMPGIRLTDYLADVRSQVRSPPLAEGAVSNIVLPPFLAPDKARGALVEALLLCMGGHDPATAAAAVRQRRDKVASVWSKFKELVSAIGMDESFDKQAASLRSEMLSRQRPLSLLARHLAPWLVEAQPTLVTHQMALLPTFVAGTRSGLVLRTEGQLRPVMEALDGLQEAKVATFVIYGSGHFRSSNPRVRAALYRAGADDTTSERGAGSHFAMVRFGFRGSQSTAEGDDKAFSIRTLGWVGPVVIGGLMLMASGVDGISTMEAEKT